MIYAIYVALGLVSFLTILNGFLMGSKKNQIDILLSFLLVGLVFAAFAVAGWKLGILAICIAFLSAIFTRSLAACTASRIFAVSRDGNCRPVGLPTRHLQAISQQLGRPIDPNQTAKEIFSSSNRSTDALTALLEYCASQSAIKELMNEFQISRDDLRELYYDLLRAGAGQWVCGHYVAASALAYPEALRHILLSKANGSFNIRTSYNVIMYFEQGETLQVQNPK